jgi:hypothetical protein
MKITQQELDQELSALRAFGLTEEEIEGFVEFYQDTLEIGPHKEKRVCVLNTGKKKSERASDNL